MKTNQTKGADKKTELLQQDDIIAAIQEWLLQERLLIQEVKRFKPVKQPNNPNPPWEYYLLRQRQMIVHLKQLRRRIEFIGKKDEYFIELPKLSQFANRLLDLMNRGDYTEYPAAGTAYEDLLKEFQASSPAKENKNQPPLPYRPGPDETIPDEYAPMISRYFQKLSEE